MLELSAEIMISGQPWRTNVTEDTQAVERNVAFNIGLFSHPVYVGDWDPILKDTLPPSFLPRFTAEEIKDLKGLALLSLKLWISRF